MQHFHVRVSKDGLVFSAAHFITLGPDKCERLHGHNYHVAAEVHGPLDENRYVVDFIVLRDALRAIIKKLDHRVLLPTGHPRIHVAAQRQQVEVTFAERRWVFPRSDCRAGCAVYDKLVDRDLPGQVRVELLGLGGMRLLDELESRLGFRPGLVRIELEETRGFSAVCELRDE